jgi:uncharacterized protein YjbI with pentapeptide repeats
VLGAVLVRIGYTYGQQTGFSEQTLWDWLDLLFIPLVLVVGAYVLNRVGQKQAQLIENQRAESEAVRTYLDQMSHLMVDAHLHQSAQGSQTRILARALTLAVLEGLSSSYKRTILQFLYEAGLLNKQDPIIDLRNADLTRTNLSGMSVFDISLRGANLRGTVSMGQYGESVRDRNPQLAEAWLRKQQRMEGRSWRPFGTPHSVYLGGADLSEAHLEQALLAYIDLSDADLRRAVLQDVILDNADLSYAKLEDADLSEATLNWTTFRGAMSSDRTQVKKSDLERWNCRFYFTVNFSRKES